MNKLQAKSLQQIRKQLVKHFWDDQYAQAAIKIIDSLLEGRLR